MLRFALVVASAFFCLQLAVADPVTGAATVSRIPKNTKTASRKSSTIPALLARRGRYIARDSGCPSGWHTCPNYPDYCAPDGSYCCNSVYNCPNDENCFGGDECCPKDSQTCGGADCCVPGSECCNDGGCCKPGYNCCNDSAGGCCPTGSTCIANTNECSYSGGGGGGGGGGDGGSGGGSSSPPPSTTSSTVKTTISTGSVTFIPPSTSASLGSSANPTSASGGDPGLGSSGGGSPLGGIGSAPRSLALLSNWQALAIATVVCVPLLRGLSNIF